MKHLLWFIVVVFSLVADHISLERSASHPAQLQSSAANTRSASPKLHGLKILKRGGNSGSDISSKGSLRESPSPTKKAPKLDRHSTEPYFSQFEQPKVHKGGKKIGLFKKKTGNYSPIIEEEMDRDKERLLVSEHHPKPRSPILSSPARRKKVDPDFVWKEADHGGPAANGSTVAPHSPGRPLVRPASSPKLVRRGSGSGPSSIPASGMVPGQNSGGASPGQRKPRRPPPPVPRPYAIQHGKGGLSNLLQRQMSDEANKEDVWKAPSPTLSPPLMMKPAPESPPLITISPELQQEEEASVRARREEENALAPPPSSMVKGSSSMEELFKNLQEFDDLNGGPVNELGVKKEEGLRDYATIPRSELPVLAKKVEEDEEDEEEKEEEMGGDSEMKVNKNKFTPQTEISVPESRLESESQVSQRKSHSPVEPPKSMSVSKPNPAPKKPEIAAKKPDIGKKPMLPPHLKNSSPPLPRPLQNGLEREKKSGSPQPVPPPRTKRKPPMSKIMRERMMLYEKQEEEKRQEGLEPTVSSKPHPHTDVPQKPPRAREATKDKLTSRLKVLEAEASGQCASAPISSSFSSSPSSSFSTFFASTGRRVEGLCNDSQK